MSKHLGYKDTWGDIKRWFANQSKSRVIITILILLAIIYVLFGFGYDDDYHKDVEYEIKLAMVICENSRNWVLEDTSRLKHGHDNLDQLKIEGKTIKLKHLKYPEVLFLDSGIRNLERKSTANDLFCHFKDPRSGSKQYFYNYKTRQWVDKVRLRR